MTRLGEHGLGARIAYAAAGWLDPGCRRRGRRRASRVSVVGHRGAARDRPENTLASFSRALELGADAIETDICATRDGRFVLWHDADPDEAVALLRQAGAEGYAYRPAPPELGSPWRRPVRELDFDDLRSRYGYVPVDGEGPAAPIASMEELFDWAEGTGALERILLDLKFGEAETATAAALLETVRRTASRERLRGIVFHLLCPQREVVATLFDEASRGGLPENVRICADFELPGALKAPLPSAAREVSLGCGERLWPGFRREVCRVVAARERGAFDRVVVWTISQARRLRELLRIGVDGILTDDVALLQRLADRVG